MAANVEEISKVLRKSVHDINNSLFVIKGYTEELHEDVTEDYIKVDTSDKEGVVKTLSILMITIEKLEGQVKFLQNFGREDIFNITG